MPKGSSSSESSPNKLAAGFAAAGAGFAAAGAAAGFAAGGATFFGLGVSSSSSSLPHSALSSLSDCGAFDLIKPANGDAAGLAAAGAGFAAAGAGFAAGSSSESESEPNTDAFAAAGAAAGFAAGGATFFGLGVS